MNGTNLSSPAEGRVSSNGIEIVYEAFGRDSDPVLLLIMGLGTQLTGWPDDFCTDLAGRGFRVIRFDNRDIGLSTKMEGAGDYDSPRAAFAKSLLGMRVRAPYKLADMARDAVGLMDALGVGPAHVVGASMGGMIAQIMAAEHASRVASLTSIMSTSGARGLPQGRPGVLWRLGARPKSKATEDIVEHLVTTMRMIGSPELQRSRAEWAEQIRKGVERSYYPPGTTRQLLAIMASGSREAALARITAPSLVIHGDADPLVPLGHGEHTAQCIPGARLEVIEGMGHDLPPVLVPRLADLIARHAGRGGP